MEEKREKAVQWREIEVNKVVQIINSRNVNIGGRQSIILTLKDEDRNIQDVWASSLIVEKIQQDKDSWIDKQVFIISRGRKNRKTNATTKTSKYCVSNRSKIVIFYFLSTLRHINFVNIVNHRNIIKTRQRREKTILDREKGLNFVINIHIVSRRDKLWVH